MKITYRFTTCVTCAGNPPGDHEHIIPSVIGGRLSANVLCTACNRTLGHRLVAQLKSDPSIRLAVEDLQPRIPTLAARFLDKAVYSGRGEDGSEVKASRSGDQLRILPTRDKDGTLSMDTSEALGALATKLQRGGFPETDIKIFAEAFAEKSENEPLSLPTGDTFVKRTIPPLRPHLSGQVVDDRFWVLVALEYAAVILGNRVLSPSFNPAREFLQGSGPSAAISIDKLSAGNANGPFHILRLAPTDGLLSVQIRLFRWLTSIVVFRNIQYEGIDPVYFEDLEARLSYFAPTFVHAKQNRWHLLP